VLREYLLFAVFNISAVPSGLLYVVQEIWRSVLSHVDDSSQSKVLVSIISKFAGSPFFTSFPSSYLGRPAVLNRTVDSNIQRFNQLDQRVVV
jgi:hypothetical protein